MRTEADEARLLFTGLRMLEGYLLLPMIERKAASLLPAFTITMQVLMSIPFGLLGVALATPLTAVMMVLIAMLYVQDLLHNETTLPAGHEDTAARVPRQ